MQHIKLITIKRQLQAKMHYPLEPDTKGEYLTLDEAFDELLCAFSKWLVRNGQGAPNIVWISKQRGWMTEKLADAFTEYCIPGWRIV